MKKIFIIKNIKGGPWKVRFKLGTPHDIMSKVNGVLKVGALLRIPEDVADYVNETYLKTSRDRGVIAYRMLVIEDMGPPPVTKLVNRPPSKKVLDKKKETPKKKETKVSSDSEKEGK